MAWPAVPLAGGAAGLSALLAEATGQVSCSMWCPSLQCRVAEMGPAWPPPHPLSSHADTRWPAHQQHCRAGSRGWTMPSLPLRCSCSPRRRCRRRPAPLRSPSGRVRDAPTLLRRCASLRRSSAPRCCLGAAAQPPAASAAKQGRLLGCVGSPAPSVPARARAPSTGAGGQLAGARLPLILEPLTYPARPVPRCCRGVRPCAVRARVCRGGGCGAGAAAAGGARGLPRRGLCARARAVPAGAPSRPGGWMLSRGF